MNLILSDHAREMLKERDIPEEWVLRTIDRSDRQETRKDNNVHYFKRIDEREGRILHVVVNPRSSPQMIVTVFFDRKERKTHEAQSRQTE